MEFSKKFLEEVVESIQAISLTEIEKTVEVLEQCRRIGRLFIIGSGGCAGHASHACADFRKLCNIEAYSFDNLPELTARVNDEGWENVMVSWLKASNFGISDCLFVISVGGGTNTVSANITNAIAYVNKINGSILGIVGSNGGATRTNAHVSILIETNDFVTPITEGLQSVVLHLLVTHPTLNKNKTIW
jgi:D-sedoheptulose 7-phosphate isomerase